MKVSRWGKSLAVRLPAALVEQLQIREGDEVEIDIGAQRLEVGSAQSRSEKPKRLLTLVRKGLPEGYKFDREEANSR